VTLLLVRHAQTVWHAENRYAGGDSDIDLTPDGAAQAAGLAAWAAGRGVDAVVSSPVRRARETAAPCADAVGVPLRVVDGLREVSFGIAEGRTLAELDPGVAARFRAGSPFPGSEPFDDAARRGADALRELAGAGTVLVVAHNTLLRLALCALLGLPPARYRQVFPRLDNTAVTEIDLPADRASPAALLRLNVPVPARPVPAPPVTSSTTKES
jgi:probable phosphoglycerate mutase